MRRVQLFGKLPAHGDFVARGVGRAEWDALDTWLSLSLTDARAHLNGGFEAAYDVAPTWLFAEEDIGGALAPSMDSVGRRFPVWLALNAVAEDEASAAATGCEGLIRAALVERWSAERLIAEAAALPLATAAHKQGWWVEDAAGGTVATRAGVRPPDLITAMLAVAEEVR